ncbi:MFS general substrate transporter [Phlebopus sp. FC_14]|nr:MFS general substrate transporter [Phlebopus sp. FC_14]
MTQAIRSNGEAPAPSTGLEPELEKSAPGSGSVDVVDGGLRAWMTILGGWLITTSTWGYVNAFGVYQDVYTRSDTASASNVSWIGSTQLFFLLAVGLPAGKLLDAGYFRYTNIFGSLLYVFSLFMVSLAHPDKYYQVYLSQGLGLGIGAGLLYVPAVAVQAHHWRKRRAFAMGVVVSSGSSVGGIFFPIMLNQLFNSSAGFQWGVRASAFVVLGLLAIANLLISDNPTLNKQVQSKPPIRTILTDVPYILSIFSVILIDWGIFFPYFYLQLFAILHGVDADIAFYTLAVMNAAAIPGRIIPGMLADRFGPFNVMLPALVANAVLVFALFGVSTTASTLVFAILYGFSSGAFLTLCAPCTAALARHPNEIGIRFGIAFSLTGLGALTGAPINGALLGQTFPWFKPIIFSGVRLKFLVCFPVTYGPYHRLQFWSDLYVFLSHAKCWPKERAPKWFERGHLCYRACRSYPSK